MSLIKANDADVRCRSALPKT